VGRRVEGAKAAARDVDRCYRAYVTEHLGELVDGHEADGRVAADRFNAVAADLLAAYAEDEQIAARIGRTIVVVARPGPLDVSRPRAEEAVRAVAALVAAGGEKARCSTRAGRRGTSSSAARTMPSRLVADVDAVSA
jgi:hypothetical protein